MSAELKRVWYFSIAFAAFAAIGVFTLAPFTENINFLPDEGFNWYYWKLPDPNFWSRASSWGLYAAHQIFVWYAIYWAASHKKELGKWSEIHKINYVMLGGTAAFIALHYLQTAIFFDGTGQDVQVIWSQGSVVIMLVLVIVMEAPRRGLIFGQGKGLFAKIQPFLFRYHGYYISWAIVFTFWYHPMYPTWGHVTGFFYMFLIFIQLSLMFTSVHVNRPWTFAIESMVILHAIVMSLVNAQREGTDALWAMFGFGFAGMAIGTQIYGLNLSKHARWAVIGFYVVAVIVTYSIRGWDKINEIIRIPVIEYLGAIVIGYVLLLIITRKNAHLSSD